MKFLVIDDDDDASQNGGPFTFEIRSGNSDNSFRITQQGQLRTATTFDHRVKARYRLQIRVYDYGQPPLFSDAWVTIQVSYLLHLIFEIG